MERKEYRDVKYEPIDTTVGTEAEKPSDALKNYKCLRCNFFQLSFQRNWRIVMWKL